MTRGWTFGAWRLRRKNAAGGMMELSFRAKTALGTADSDISLPAQMTQPEPLCRGILRQEADRLLASRGYPRCEMPAVFGLPCGVVR